MIDDVKRALEALREPVWGEPVRVVNDRLRTAALMIENMIEEHERTQRTIVCLTLQIADSEKKCSEWKNRANALEHDLRHIKMDNCEVCKHCANATDCDCECIACKLECACKSCTDGDKWEWRGPCAENGGIICAEPHE